MPWAQEKLRMESMTPEELAAYKEHRKRQQAATYKRRKAKEAKTRALPPAEQKIVREAEDEESRARRRAAEKRQKRRAEATAEINAFLAAGAQERGFSAFLRSKEIRIADQLTYSRQDCAA